MYARGMSTREIVAHLRELYGIEVSPNLISTVIDAVLEEVTAWQARSLEPVYTIVFFDALRIKVCDEGVVRDKAVYIALGIPQRLARAADLGRNRADRAVLRIVLALVLQHYPHSAFTNLTGKRRGSLRGVFSRAPEAVAGPRAGLFQGSAALRDRPGCVQHLAPLSCLILL